MKHVYTLLLALCFTVHSLDVAIPRITSLVDDRASIQAHVDDILGERISVSTVSEFLNRIGGTHVFHDFTVINRESARLLTSRIRREYQMSRGLAILSGISSSILVHLWKDLVVVKECDFQRADMITPLLVPPAILATMMIFFSHQAYHLSKLEKTLSRS